MKGGLYIVAGASGAIGRTLCSIIVDRGGIPLLIGRSYEKLREVAHQCNSLKHSQADYRILPDVDFANPAAAGSILQNELQDIKHINGLAYCVGSITLKPVKSCKLNDYLDSYHLNVLGAVELIKASLNGLKNGAAALSATSSIVLFSSVAVQHGFTNHSVISCSKGAIEGLTRSLAAELVTQNIRVNCIAPSLTMESNMSRSMTSNEKIANAIASSHPINRLGLPRDSAEAAAYLLSHDSSWITGTILPVDGGRSSVLK